MLNNLGILYSDTGRLAEADKAFSEALTIRRDLAARDPGAYRPDVATTLNNLGLLHSNTGRLAEADKAFSEALTNRIKECQLDLYADRTSAHTMRANQLRLWFASMAYVLVCALRRIGLKHTRIYRDLMSSNPTKYEGQIASLTKLLATIRGKSSEPYPDPAQH
jgi:hypothetical protein